MQVGSMSYGRGPLSIEMGAITGAVDDLVSGYESLVTALPDVAQRVNDMQNGTEDMAHRLEDRMRYLIDGYEYLDSVSSQIPPTIQKMAASHRKNLMSAAELLGTVDREDLARHEGALENLRGELKSMAYERVVMDVLTRQAIKDSKRKAPHVASTRVGGYSSARSNAQSHTARSGPSAPSSKSKTETPSTHPEDVHSPINIGRFTSNYATPQPSRATTKPVLSPHKNPQRYDVISAQASAGGVVVPSVRTGMLPEELRHIKSTPNAKVIGDSRKRRIPKGQYPAKKRSASRGRSKSPTHKNSGTSRHPSEAGPSNAVVEGLKHNIEQSARQIGDVKDRLESAESRRAEDQEYMDRKLDDIKGLIVENEQENQKRLEDMKRKASRSGRKRVVVETIADDRVSPAGYKVLPARTVSSPSSPVDANAAKVDPKAEGIAFTGAPRTQSGSGPSVFLSEPPAKEVPVEIGHKRSSPALPGDKKASKNTANNAIPIAAGDVTSRGEGHLIVITGSGSGSSEKDALARGANNGPEIIISAPSSERTPKNRSRGAKASSPLPVLQDQTCPFDTKLSQHNRPLQPWISRVKMNSPDGDDKADAAISGSESDIPEPAAREEEKSGEPIAPANDQGWVNAHYPSHPGRLGNMEHTLMDLVKGMVLHQQSTIESQAELMKSVLLAADASRHPNTAHSDLASGFGSAGADDSNDSADVETRAGDLIVEDIDGNSADFEPGQRSTKIVQVTPAEPAKVYKTSFGRLLALGPDFGTKPSAPVQGRATAAGSIDSPVQSDVVLDTLYAAASHAVDAGKQKANNFAQNAVVDIGRGTLGDIPSPNIHNLQYQGASEMGSSRLASLNTVKAISALKPDPREEKPLDSHSSPVAQLVHEVLGALKTAFGAPQTDTQKSSSEPAKKRAESSKATGGDDVVVASDPRYLEQLMIEECVERAVRAALPYQALNVGGRAQSVNCSSSNPRNSSASRRRGVPSEDVSAEDTENEWVQHDENQHHDIGRRPTGGFPHRVRSDLSGHYQEDEYMCDREHHFNELGNETKKKDRGKSKVVAGPGGLVFYGARDGWSDDRCANENQYQSYKQSKIPYQRYVNRNGMNHDPTTEPAAVEHFRGSDEDGFDDQQAPEFTPKSTRRLKHADINTKVVQTMNSASNPKSANGGNREEQQESIPRRHIPDTRASAGGPGDDVADIVKRDLEELQSYRRNEEDNRCNDTRSSISEYSSGGEAGNFLSDKRASRVPQEAIELEYMRRAKRSSGAMPATDSYENAPEFRRDASKGGRRSNCAPEPLTSPGIGVSAFGIPTPLVSKQLGHDATAEVAMFGASGVTLKSSSYVPMHERNHRPADSDSDEANVQYPAPFISKYHSIPAARREVAGRNIIEPRSRFLRNLQPVSDDSSATSEHDAGNYKKGENHTGVDSSRYQYLGDPARARRTRDMLSECSSGSPASSLDTSRSNVVPRKYSGKRRDEGDKLSYPARKSLTPEDASSSNDSDVPSKQNNGPGRVENKKIDDDIVRQPNVFVPKLRLGLAGHGEKSQVGMNNISHSSISTGAESNINGESWDNRKSDRSDDDTEYYSSMDSSVSVSSTSQSFRVHSRY